MEVESGVAQRFRLALPLYLFLLVVLALMGIVNQRLLAEQVDLMDQKDELLAEVASARIRAAEVDGPEAVAAWAAMAGMVAVPEAGAARLIAAAPAPEASHTEPVLELTTVWR